MVGLRPKKVSVSSGCRYLSRSALPGLRCGPLRAASIAARSVGYALSATPLALACTSGVQRASSALFSSCHLARSSSRCVSASAFFFSSGVCSGAAAGGGEAEATGGRRLASAGEEERRRERAGEQGGGLDGSSHGDVPNVPERPRQARPDVPSAQQPDPAATPCQCLVPSQTRAVQAPPIT